MADSEKYFTKLVDGQLSVATVAQNGEIIPEESRPGDKYTTALVQTDDGPQLCVKTYDLNGGGGGGGTVDQTYDPTSTNAQSGTAVAEAVEPALKNTATGTNSLTILGTPTNHTNVINIGYSNNTSTSENTVAIGNSVTTNNHQSVVVGHSAKSNGGSVTVGYSAQGNALSSVTIGSYAESSSNSSRYKIAIGAYAYATQSKSIAIGGGDSKAEAAQANAKEAIQIGTGINSTAKTLQVFEYQLLDGNTGKIPAERIGTGYDASKTQVLKNVNGTLTWVDE
jgi:hypothetical protein